VPIRKFNDKQPIIGESVYIDDSAIVIGDVTLGNDVSIWPATVIRGDVESIKIGDGTNVQDVLYCMCLMLAGFHLKVIH